MISLPWENERRWVPLEEYKWAPLLLSKHPIVTPCSHNFSVPTCYPFSWIFSQVWTKLLNVCFLEHFKLQNCVFVQALKDFRVPSSFANLFWSPCWSFCILISIWLKFCWNSTNLCTNPRENPLLYFGNVS